MYTPLTLVFKDTWTDADQGSLNTNPIVLDSRGQAIIYGVGAYRQILTDADGNTIWDAEISGFQDSVFGPQVTVASAATTNLGAASSNNVLISGTTTITSFGTSASLSNPIYFIQFSGILQLTYNATSMILPGAANITTAAGDSALVEVTNAASGYWRMIAYFSNTSGGALGTAASYNIGTSGATVPLLNQGNTWSSGSQVFNCQTSSPEFSLSISAGHVLANFAGSSNFNLTTGVSIVMDNPINTQVGQSGVFCIIQSAGALTMTWGTSFKAPGGIATVNLSGVNGATDVFAYYVHSSTFIIITPILNPT